MSTQGTETIFTKTKKAKLSEYSTILFTTALFIVSNTGCNFDKESSTRQGQTSEPFEQGVTTSGVEKKPNEEHRETGASEGALMPGPDEPSLSEQGLFRCGQFNIAIRFPSEPQVSSVGSGERYQVAESTTRRTVDVIDGADESREELFDAIQQAVRESPGALIIESSPVRWKGHYGREWAFFHEIEIGTKFLTHCRDICVGGKIYQLRLESVFVASGGDPDLMRHSFKDDAIEFFDSMRLIEFVSSSKIPISRTLLGRWIVVSENGRPVHDGDTLVFAGGTKFGGFRSGNENDWGVPGGGIRQRGFYSCNDDSYPPTEIKIVLLSDPTNGIPATCKFDDDTLQLVFESGVDAIGLAKSLLLRRPGDHSPPSG